MTDWPSSYVVLWVLSMIAGWLAGKAFGFLPSIGLIVAAFVVGTLLEYQRRKGDAD